MWVLELELRSSKECVRYVKLDQGNDRDIHV